MEKPININDHISFKEKHEKYGLRGHIHDDEKILNGREKTNGSPKTVVEYLKDEIPNINVGIVDAIKRGRAWNGVLNN